MSGCEAVTADVVVIGGGIAGLTCALAAQEAGSEVILLEKLAEVGGSSRMSGGFFAFVGTHEQDAAAIDDSRELFRDDLVALGGGVADETLIDAYLEAEGRTYEWLRGHGVEFDKVELSSGQSAARSHHSDIRSVLSDFARRFTEAGGTLLTNTSAATLLIDEGARVSGVVTDDGRTIGARRGVVLATGGFSRSRELLQIFAPSQLRAIPYGGVGNTGDGLRMAWALGAGVADMGYIAATYGSHPDTGDGFHELLTAYYLGAIVVNTTGRRFMDESQSYKILGRVVLEQPDGLGFEIFDAAVRAKSQRGLALKDMDTLEDLGHLHRAETLGELAEIIGVPAAALEETVANYNAAARGERDDDFGRESLVNGGGLLREISEAPFYAYPAKALMTSTYCGLTIDPTASVLRIDGSPIIGLFAVGEVTGGFHGEAYMTGTSLGKGAVFGLIAASRLATTGG